MDYMGVDWASGPDRTAFFIPGIPVIEDSFLSAGQVRFFDGRLHIGKGTDIHAILFEMNLSPDDRQFLESLHVGR